MSGEIQHDVADSYRTCRKEIESIFNLYFEGKDFGNGLVKIAYIAIIRATESADYGEACKYRRRDRTAEFRLKVSHNSFLKADLEERKSLIATSVWHAIKALSSLKVSEFDFSMFETEYKKLATPHGWNWSAK